MYSLKYPILHLVEIYVPVMNDPVIVVFCTQNISHQIKQSNNPVVS